MEERLKILEMLRDGVITVEEASELLRTIDEAKSEAKEEPDVKIITTKKTTNQKAKMLRISVDSAEGDVVNVNIPVSFLKAAIASGTINNLYNKSFNVKGVDQEVIKDSLDINLLIECVENDFVGNLVDIESGNGDVVRIYFE
jgi:hypothetical protein